MTTTAESRAAFRLALAKHEAPRALGWTAATVGVLSLLNPLINPAGFTPTDLLHVGVFAVMVLGAVLAGRTWMPAAASPWIVAVCALTVVGAFQFEVWSEPTALGVVYVLMAMLAYGPFTLSFGVMSAAAIPMMLGFAIAAEQWAPDDVARWIAAALAALLIGGVILRVRLQGIDALGELTETNRELATRDALTGAFNRRGVEERAPEIIALAGRQKAPVFVAFVDVDGLKAANDRFGHEFGDSVLTAVAQSVKATMRAADIVARWGGDEFIVLGIGRPLPPDVIEERLHGHIAGQGLDPAKWSGDVSIGVAMAEADEVQFIELVRAADVHMYQRRRTRRAL